LVVVCGVVCMGRRVWADRWRLLERGVDRSVRRCWAVWLGRVLLLLRWKRRWLLLGRLDWSRVWSGRVGLPGRDMHGRLGFLLLCEDLGKLIDVCLEELELFLCGLASGNNLHDSLELGVGAGAGCQHVNDGIWGRR
jgi:hypothetical protein